MPNFRRIQRKIQNAFRQNQGDWIQLTTAALGNYDESVQTGVDGLIYARLRNGQVVTVYNDIAPEDFDVKVIIGKLRDQPTLWRVKAVRDSYSVPQVGTRVKYHHEQHQFDGPDMVPIDRKQITTLTVLVSDAANYIVQVYGGVVRMPDGYVKIDSQTLDLSAEVVTEGAVYVAIESDADGVLSTNTGTPFAAKGLATAGDMPVPGSGKYTIAFVLFHEGQSELSNDDIALPFPFDTGANGIFDDAPSDDLYYGRQNGAWAIVTEEAPEDGSPYARKDGAWQEIVGGGGTVESVTGDGVDNTDPANPVLSYPTPGDIGAQPAGSYLTAANIEDSISDGVTTKAPSENAVFDALAGKQSALGFTPENVANKDTDANMAANSDTKYMSQKAARTAFLARGMQPYAHTRTVAALPAYTYNNGSSGIGATITCNTNIDIRNGAYLSEPDFGNSGGRLLVAHHDGAHPEHNGIYVVTQTGEDGVSPFILTRATDFDQNDEIVGTRLVFVLMSGAGGDPAFWSIGSGLDSPVIGTSPIYAFRLAGAGLADEITLQYVLDYPDLGIMSIKNVTPDLISMPKVGSPTIDTLSEDFTTRGSSGVVDGTLTYIQVDTGAHKVKVAAGEGYLRTSNDQQAELKLITWSAATQIDIPAPAAGQETVRFIGIEYNAGTPQVTSRTTFNWNWYTDFPLGRVSYDGTTLRILNAYAHAEDLANLVRRRWRLTQPFQKEQFPEGTGGFAIAETGTRNLTISAANVWHGLNQYVISAFDSSGAGTFDIYWQKSGGGFNSSLAATQWPNTQYDDGTGTLHTMTNTNKFAVLWIYMDIADGRPDILYGRNEYNTLALAQAESRPATMPAHMLYHSVIIGRLIFQKSAATAVLIENFTEAGATGGATYTDEDAQDAVGAMLADTATIDFTYTDATPELKADVIPGGIKLDDLGTPDDNTDLNANTTNHGLVVKAVAPAGNILNVVGIANGETAYANKAIFDGTNPAALGAAAPGTSLIAAHRDHVHPTTGLVLDSLSTALNDFLAGSGSNTWIKKTLAETLTILGKAAASGLASLDANSVLVQAVNLILAGTGALAATEGATRWDSTRKLQLIYDTQRERGISPIGWMPFAYPQGYDPTATAANLPDLAAAGGCVAMPVMLYAPMLVQSVTVRNQDATLQRIWNWYLYEQYLNNGNAGENTLTRVASGTQETFTAAAASNRTSNASGAPVFLSPGLYWLVIQNQHASNTFRCAQVASNTTMALNNCMTKTIANPAGSTLDFVAATWAKQTYTICCRLDGRVFGQTAAF